MAMWPTGIHVAAWVSGLIDYRNHVRDLNVGKHGTNR